MKAPNDEPPRWEFLRDVAVFQVKLALDWLRDLLLSPISLVAALAGLLFRSDRPSRYFYDVIHLGRRTERWINLFGAGDRVPPSEAVQERASTRNIDAVIEPLEKRLAAEVERGGATATAKRAVDRALDAVKREPRGHKRSR